MINGNNKFWIDLKFYSEVVYVVYSFFVVKNEVDNYKLIVGDYLGNFIFFLLSLMY